jgi:hypothetical protein
METNLAYQQRINEQLQDWNVLVCLLAEKLENAEVDFKPRYVHEYAAIKTTQREAADKIKELENASGDAWMAAKDAANKGLRDFGSGLAKAIEEFK